MKYIITSGPMKMAIDDVRQIENTSTGRLGCSFVEELQKAGISDIVYIHTAGAIVPKGDLKRYLIKSHNEIIEVLREELTDDTVVIHAMAISDFSFSGNIKINDLANSIYSQIDKIKNPEDIKEIIENNVSLTSKLSSKDDQVLLLKQEIKVIDQIKKINESCKLIGFKLLSEVSIEQLIGVANDILKRANCDYVVANRKEDITKDKHQALIIGNGVQYDVESKKEIAKKIIEIMEEK